MDYSSKVEVLQKYSLQYLFECAYSHLTTITNTTTTTSTNNNHRLSYCTFHEEEELLHVTVVEALPGIFLQCHNCTTQLKLMLSNMLYGGTTEEQEQTCFMICV